ncbi:hypothetical protein AAG570_004471, partial [Ranatra chinensis]
LYVGKLCGDFLTNKTIFIPGGKKQSLIEEKLYTAFTVIKNSGDLSKTCEAYAFPSLCFTAFPVCRDDILQPPIQICRQDCEMLENEICKKEYAIAKRHPLIGMEIHMPSCQELPLHGSVLSDDCHSLGLPSGEPTIPGDFCYHGNGEGYRGALALSVSKRPCIAWNEQLQISTAEYAELLGGHNYCRNPGGELPQPWCFTHAGAEFHLQKELCAVPRCDNPIWMYLGGAGIVILLIILLIFSCCKARKNRQSNGIPPDSTVKGSKNSPCRKGKGAGVEMSALIPESGASSVKSDSRARVREFHPSNIRFVQELGEGAFGKVYKGEIVGVGEEPIQVAIKTLKENASAKTTGDFRREVDLMCELRHENIVCLLGVCLSREPLCMLFEFMPRGDLHEYLIAHSPPNSDSPLTQHELLTIATHIASGMEYLCSHHYVHRDLAARNCLVGENHTVKISDFGLSRDVYSSDYYRVQSKSLLPVRWMPPESILYGKFTTESDVWSYGVVLWEIYSFGLQPYYGYSNQEVIEMIRSRQLLPCPEDCPSRMYSVMMECWHEVPLRRPHFPEICARLRSFQLQNSNGSGQQHTVVRMPHHYPNPTHL